MKAIDLARLSVLAVIPARGGSKGIPRKNLRCIGGQTLIARAVEAARQLPWIDRVVISTDDEEMAEEGRRHGAAAPFMRPPELADDRATAIDTWRHAWLASESHFAMRFEYSVLLEPTSPLRHPSDIEQALRLLIAGGHRTVASVSRTPAHYTPERSLCIDGDGRLHPYLAQGLSHTARQTIPAYYHRNGIVYAVTRGGLVDEGNLMARDCAALLIERPVANIDEAIDLEWAEFLLARQRPA